MMSILILSSEYLRVHKPGVLERDFLVQWYYYISLLINEYIYTYTDLDGGSKSPFPIWEDSMLTNMKIYTLWADMISSKFGNDFTNPYQYV